MNSGKSGTNRYKVKTFIESKVQPFYLLDKHCFLSIFVCFFTTWLLKLG